MHADYLVITAVVVGFNEPFLIVKDLVLTLVLK